MLSLKNETHIDLSSSKIATFGSLREALVIWHVKSHLCSDKTWSGVFNGFLSFHLNSLEKILFHLLVCCTGACIVLFFC